MNLYALLHRAAILTCVQYYGPAHLEAFAHVLGYTRPPAAPEPASVPLTSEPMPLSVPAPVSPEPAPVLPVAPTPARFYRVVAQRQLTAAEVQRDAPAWYQEAVPLTLDDPAFRADPQAPLPPPAPPLMPWARLWP